jgi:hypothetical protein
MTVDQLIIELRSDFKAYSESGLLDDITLRRHIIQDCKKFGGNIMDVESVTLEIKNNQAKLPENFWSLYYAVKATPKSCEIDDETGCVTEEDLIGDYFYRVRVEASKEFDNQSNVIQAGEYKEVREKTYLHRTKTNATFTYGNFQHLVLKKGHSRQMIDKNCKNLGISDSPYEIYINRETLYTNFNKGFVTLWYQGLETDEEGDILLPEETQIYDYLMYSAKHKILESIYGNEDADVQQKMMYFGQMKQQHFMPAMTTAKMRSVTGKDWWKGMKQQQQKRVRVFESFPRI